MPQHSTRWYIEQCGNSPSGSTDNDTISEATLVFSQSLIVAVGKQRVCRKN
jgi:hypothetical protein